jgi:hypothetical protein
MPPIAEGKIANAVMTAKILRIRFVSNDVWLM